MKKEVFISIRGVQHIGEEEDVTELFTQGTFTKKTAVSISPMRKAKRPVLREAAQP